MERLFHTPKARQSPQTHKLIARIKNTKKRNLLRGHCSKTRFTAYDIEEIRRNNTIHDIKIIGAVLKGPHNLINEDKKKKKAQISTT